MSQGRPSPPCFDAVDYPQENVHALVGKSSPEDAHADLPAIEDESQDPAAERETRRRALTRSMGFAPICYASGLSRPKSIPSYGS